MLVYAYPYALLLGKPIEGGIIMFVAHVIRQSGHFFYENQDRDIEKLKFGHKDKSKKVAAVSLAMIAVTYYYMDIIDEQLNVMKYLNMVSAEQYTWILSLSTIVPHFVDITNQYVSFRFVLFSLLLFHFVANIANIDYLLLFVGHNLCRVTYVVLNGSSRSLRILLQIYLTSTNTL